MTLAVRLAEYKSSLGHAYPIGTAGTRSRVTLLPVTGQGGPREEN